METLFLTNRPQSVITGITTLFSYGLNTGGPGGRLSETPWTRGEAALGSGC
jgi:hypothetical protein